MPSTRDGDNMANSATAPATDEARYVTLAAQFRGLDEDVKDLKGFAVSLDRKIETTSAALGSKIDLMVNGLGNKFEAAVAGLQSKFEERNRIQWPALSVMVSVLALIGALVYWPIRENTIVLRSDMSELANKVVYSRTYDGERGAQNERIKEMIDVLRLQARQLQDTRETVARHEQADKNLEQRLDAISRRLAEHIRDVTRIDRTR